MRRPLSILAIAAFCGAMVFATSLHSVVEHHGDSSKCPICVAAAAHAVDATPPISLASVPAVVELIAVASERRIAVEPAHSIHSRGPPAA